LKSFAPIHKKPRISQEVVAQLKNAILTGLYKPGEKIPPERELTEQFQVSRVVIREALRELELKGFVKIHQGPAGGAYVLDLSFDQLSDALLDLFKAGKLSVVELIQVRLHIEPEIARLAALNADARAIDRLKQALEREQETGTSHSATVSRRFQVDHILAEMCGNRLYQAISKAILDLTREIILVVKSNRTVIFRHDEHVQIVRAVEQRDPEAAAEAVRRHLMSIGTGLEQLEKAYRKQMGFAK